MRPVPDRPPVLRFLALFGAMLTLALSLAALSPDGGPVERTAAEGERSIAAAVAPTQARPALP